MNDVKSVSGSDTVTRPLRMDRDLWVRIRVLAAQEEKSAAQWMREALTLVVERSERG
jgi:predicted HicB family RNase H-like nuclease